MYQLVLTNSFKKDVKRLQKRRVELDTLKKAILTLEAEGQLPLNYKPHKLLGNYSGYWEAHLKSDWLIIWKAIESRNEIWLIRTETHSDLFS